MYLKGPLGHRIALKKGTKKQLLLEQLQMCSSMSTKFGYTNITGATLFQGQIAEKGVKSPYLTMAA